jgi:SAM-dependent methyltransferase
MQEKILDQNYWDNQYQVGRTAWDLGLVSPPIKKYFDQLEDKNQSILIPGGGNSYEAEYLLQQGFTDITVVDIAPSLVEKLKEKFQGKLGIKILLGDFFEHQAAYDMIVEQTFFCALAPTMRQQYVWKMHQLLKPNALLVGLLFNRTFEGGPPFGGNINEYKTLFSPYFHLQHMATAPNSVAPRALSELWIELKKI